MLINQLIIRKCNLKCSCDFSIMKPLKYHKVLTPLWKDTRVNTDMFYTDRISDMQLHKCDAEQLFKKGSICVLVEVFA